MTAYPAPPPPRLSEASNTLGIVGFVLSILGLVSCGIFSPVGLIVSAIAIFREPRGFAIAGLILGILGSGWVLVVAAVVGFGAAVALVLAAVGFERFEAEIKMEAITQEVRAFHQDYGVLPSSLADLPGLGVDELTDPWGRPFVYDPGTDATSRTFRVISPGKDGALGTGDDIVRRYTVAPDGSLQGSQRRRGPRSPE